MTNITDKFKERLKTLSEAVGVSGDESAVRSLILEAIKDKATDITLDPMGSVTAIRKGTGDGSLRVLVSAHMDEIGFMVASVDDGGLIHIEKVGDHDGRFLPAGRVLVGAARTPGVFLWGPIHKTLQKKDIIAADDMLIDVGAKDKGGVRVEPGDRIAFASTFGELGPGVVRGKAFDSRAACAILLDLLEGEPFPFDLVVAFTTQAVIGGRGAAVAAHRTDPQAAFVLTGMTTHDLPADLDEIDNLPAIRMGGGPILNLLDRDIVADRRLVAHVRETARTAKLPLQFYATTDERSDSGMIGSVRAGVPSVALGLPIRYLGSPNALLNLDDVASLSALLRQSLQAFTMDVLNS